MVPHRSPLIALRTYLQHPQREAMDAKAEFVFFFVERDEARVTHLEEVAIPRLGQLPPNVKIHCMCSKFDESVMAMLDALEKRGGRLAPCFAFADPFGFSDTPMEVIARLLENERSEVLITFMLDWVNRFLEHPEEKIAEHYDKLFGDPGWRQLVQAADRFVAIRAFYAEQLRRVVPYVWSFSMLNERNRPIYDLFFAGGHIDGLRKIKQAMWREDRSGGARFSDRADGTLTIFEPEPDTSQLQRVLVEQFAGRTVSYTELERWVLLNSPFHDSHIKRRTLRPLEKDGGIEVVPSPFRPRKRAGTYPPDCSIRFA